MPHLFAFGLGYTARVLAKRLLAKEWRVSGTCRSAEKVAALKAIGIEAHLFDPAREFQPPASIFNDATHLLTSIAPTKVGDPVLEAFGDIIAGSNRVTQEPMKWAGYLSTTGVYGNMDGAWVNENAPTNPVLARAQRRVAAEQAWLELFLRHRVPVHIFRLAGIYGPGRNAIETVRKGTARRVDCPGQLFGRIHVEDIARVLEASITKPRPGTIYNVCDNEPAAPADVVTFACELLGVEPPPPVPLDEVMKSMSPMGRSFWADNRKVSNRRIREELGVDLAYPDYRAGLESILKGES